LELGVYFEFQIQPEGSQQQAFQTDLNHIELADKLGYDYAWLAELHFSPERSVISSPFLAACAAIHRTKNIRIGTAVSVLPLNNPVRIAEDVATLDHLSKGRFELGIGRSGAPRGYVGYSIPYQESKARFNDCLEILIKAWSQDSFSHASEFYKFDNVCVFPKPYQTPHPPIRNAATSAETFLSSAKKGFPIFVSLRGSLASLKERIDMYKKVWVDMGHQGQPNICARIPTFVSDTQEKAETFAKNSAMNFYRNFVSNLNEPVPGLSYKENTERLARSRRMRNMTYKDFLQTEGVVGDPQFVADRLLAIKTEYSLTGFMIEANFGGRISSDNVSQSLRLFKTLVAPRLLSE
jgi:alkanesulfonate monooxygenase SsuD/methylene tetrahydromethanopterin reductase-like flavin-dependent oxidoreductase (luciferase family)